MLSVLGFSLAFDLSRSTMAQACAGAALVGSLWRRRVDGRRGLAWKPLGLARRAFQSSGGKGSSVREAEVPLPNG